MKTIRIIVIALFLMPAFAMAQSQQTPAEQAKKQTEWMKQNLDLTAEQLTDVRETNLDYAEKNAQILKSDDKKQDKLNDLMAQHNNYTNEMKDILDASQYAKFIEADKEWFEQTKEKVQDTR